MYSDENKKPRKNWELSEEQRKNVDAVSSAMRRLIGVRARLKTFRDELNKDIEREEQQDHSSVDNIRKFFVMGGDYIDGYQGGSPLGRYNAGHPRLSVETTAYLTALGCKPYEAIPTEPATKEELDILFLEDLMNRPDPYKK